MKRKNRNLGILMCFVFFRLVESSSLTIMCGDKDKRSRFVSEAVKEGWIRELEVRVRERTTHQMTLYALTKKGLRYLRDNVSGSFLDDLTDGELSSVAIFDKDEYSTDARKRIADTSSAMIMALAMGGTIPACVLNRRYTFGQSNGVVSAPQQKSATTLTAFVQSRFSENEYKKLSFFGAEVPADKQICFYDAAYVKQAVSGTSDPKAARDFYKGREIGLFMSSKQSLLTYCAPFFGMSWSKWQIAPEMNAIIRWNKRYASQDILYSRQFSALLIVRDHRQFSNLYNDVDHARKEDEVFGGRFDHVYLVEHSSYGAKYLRWLLSNSDAEIEDNCTSEVLSRRLARHNEGPSRKEFLYRDSEGNEGMCGLHLDVKRMIVMDRWARNHPEEKFVIYCIEPQVSYYKAVMPDNVSYVLM